MNRTRIVLASTFALLLAATSASAATITFTFYSGLMPDGVTAIVPTEPINIGQNVAGEDLCMGSDDYCSPTLTFSKGGVTLDVTAVDLDPQRDRLVYVNEDLAPVYGGLGVDSVSNPNAQPGDFDFNPGGDNNGPDEMLKLVFSKPVTLVSFIAFRDHTNMFEFPGTTISVTGDAAQDFLVNVGQGAPLPQYGNALFSFSPTFVGSSFDFEINAEKFYISMLTVETNENVPEPATLLLLGVGLLGGVGMYRRRAPRA